MSEPQLPPTAAQAPLPPTPPAPTSAPAPAPIPTPVPPAAPTPPAVAQKTVLRNVLSDAFYVEERDLVTPRVDHPRGRYWNRHTVPPGPGRGSTPRALTVWQPLANPLNDPKAATVLAQRKEDAHVSAEVFTALAHYWLYVSPLLREAYEMAPDPATLRLKVVVFFGVGPEPNLFGLRSWFDADALTALVGVPGNESGGSGIPQAWGFGVSTAMIRTLLEAAGLPKIDFKVEVMAGYSTGYRGLNLTVVNSLVDLAHVKRLIYVDAFYNHDDHPRPAPSHKYFKKLTVWACDTVFTASVAAEVWVVGVTGGGTPRTATHEPRGPLAAMRSLRKDGVRLLDLEFKRDGLAPVTDDLEKIALARLLQGGVDDYYPVTGLPASLQPLIGLLPTRGSLGVAGRAGYTDLRTWRQGPAVAKALAAFSVPQAMTLLFEHRLLGSWTVKNAYEMRHRTFVQEIGKELLLP